MKKTIIIFLFFLPSLIFSQEQGLIKIIESLEFGPDTVETVFKWVTDNVKYDVNEKDRILEQNRSGEVLKGDQAAYEQEKLKKVIITKKGVCHDYSLLFGALLEKLGYESMVVTGYARNILGKINMHAGHAWNVVKVGDQWRFYDPTWAAGVVKDGSKFIKKYNDTWNNTPANEMIKTHMPYDPMWQLLKHPLSYDDFNSSNFEFNKKIQFDFDKLIEENFGQSDSAKAKSSLERSKQMGSANPLVKKWQSNQAKNMDSFKKMNSSEQLQEISNALNVVADKFNEYIDAKNKGFKSKKWTTEYKKSYIFELKASCERYQKFFDSYEPNGTDEKRFVIKSINTLKKLQSQLDNEVKLVIMESIKSGKK